MLRDDRLLGGPGNDSIEEPGFGDDRILGGAGDDVISGVGQAVNRGAGQTRCPGESGRSTGGRRDVAGSVRGLYSSFTPSHRAGSGPPLVCLHGLSDT